MSFTVLRNSNSKYDFFQRYEYHESCIVLYTLFEIQVSGEQDLYGGRVKQDVVDMKVIPEIDKGKEDSPPSKGAKDGWADPSEKSPWGFSFIQR